MRISDWSSDVCSSDLEVAEVPAAAPELTVAFALVKGDKPELVVQKLTELGIDRIVPLRAERSVVRWDEAKAASALTRLRAIARAAAMQSHRPRLRSEVPTSEIQSLMRNSYAVFSLIKKISTPTPPQHLPL